jgi:hypothetical protein
VYSFAQLKKNKNNIAKGVAKGIIGVLGHTLHW